MRRADLEARLADSYTEEKHARETAVADGRDSWVETAPIAEARAAVERELESLLADDLELGRLAEEERAAEAEARVKEIVAEYGVEAADQVRLLRKLGKVASVVAGLFEEAHARERRIAALRGEARQKAGATFAAERCAAVMRPFPVDLTSLFAQVAMAATSDQVRRTQTMSDQWLGSVPDLRVQDAPFDGARVEGVEPFDARIL